MYAVSPLSEMYLNSLQPENRQAAENRAKNLKEKFDETKVDTQRVNQLVEQFKNSSIAAYEQANSMNNYGAAIGIAAALIALFGALTIAGTVTDLGPLDIVAGSLLGVSAIGGGLAIWGHRKASDEYTIAKKSFDCVKNQLISLFNNQTDSTNI